MTHKPDLPCAVCGRLLWRTSTSAPEGVATCLECRRARIIHGYGSGYRKGCRCDVCVQANRASSAAGTARYIALHGEPPNAKYRRENGRPPQNRKRKPCDWCGAIHALNESGTTLDAEGMSHAHLLRFHGKPSESRELVHVPRPVPERSTTPPVVPVPSRGGVFIAGHCEWCGERFIGWTTKRLVRLCSKRCQSKENRQRSGRFVIQPRIRLALYERDNWTCQICSRPTSSAWSQGDPWAPTLDHVVPQAATSSPDHSDENLRAAHAICNTYRGKARLTDEEVANAVSSIRYSVAH